MKLVEDLLIKKTGKISDTGKIPTKYLSSSPPHSFPRVFSFTKSDRIFDIFIDNYNHSSSYLSSYVDYLCKVKDALIVIFDEKTKSFRIKSDSDMKGIKDRKDSIKNITSALHPCVCVPYKGYGRKLPLTLPWYAYPLHFASLCLHSADEFQSHRLMHHKDSVASLVCCPNMKFEQILLQSSFPTTLKSMFVECIFPYYIMEYNHIITSVQISDNLTIEVKRRRTLEVQKRTKRKRERTESNLWKHADIIEVEPSLKDKRVIVPIPKKIASRLPPGDLSIHYPSEPPLCSPFWDVFPEALSRGCSFAPSHFHVFTPMEFIDTILYYSSSNLFLECETHGRINVSNFRIQLVSDVDALEILKGWYLDEEKAVRTIMDLNSSRDHSSSFDWLQDYVPFAHVPQSQVISMLKRCYPAFTSQFRDIKEFDIPIHLMARRFFNETPVLNMALLFNLFKPILLAFVHPRETKIDGDSVKVVYESREPFQSTIGNITGYMKGKNIVGYIFRSIIAAKMVFSNIFVFEPIESAENLALLKAVYDNSLSIFGFLTFSGLKIGPYEHELIEYFLGKNPSVVSQDEETEEPSNICHLCTFSYIFVPRSMRKQFLHLLCVLPINPRIENIKLAHIIFEEDFFRDFPSPEESEMLHLDSFCSDQSLLFVKNFEINTLEIQPRDLESLILLLCGKFPDGVGLSSLPKNSSSEDSINPMEDSHDMISQGWMESLVISNVFENSNYHRASELFFELFMPTFCSKISTLSMYFLDISIRGYFYFELWGQMRATVTSIPIKTLSFISLTGVTLSDGGCRNNLAKPITPRYIDDLIVKEEGEKAADTPMYLDEGEGEAEYSDYYDEYGNEEMEGDLEHQADDYLVDPDDLFIMRLDPQIELNGFDQKDGVEMETRVDSSRKKVIMFLRMLGSIAPLVTESVLITDMDIISHFSHSKASREFAHFLSETLSQFSSVKKFSLIDIGKLTPEFGEVLASALDKMSNLACLNIHLYPLEDSFVYDLLKKIGGKHYDNLKHVSFVIINRSSSVVNPKDFGFGPNQQIHFIPIRQQISQFKLPPKNL
ncbi:hypothetical protein ADUPG1_006534 [Aduncisulcus paluster]|uniref:Uncharacterized protein n=1 Tax=Aduncisulcus paluster TaxID=2918883 RepID=A0ABQ5KIK9_9EUKA|nr:hypothetical protein ADUPG1_006534 [Aduncisulcus paluster]